MTEIDRDRPAPATPPAPPPWLLGPSAEADLPVDPRGARPARPPILVLHKPRGVVVTRQDERGRRTVFDALPPWIGERGFQAVGRLDLETRGLLLFVPDGRLQERLARPGGCEKRYEAWVRGVVTAAQAARLEAGVETAIGRLHARAVALRGGAGGRSRLEVVLDEGKNRQVRRLLAALADERTGRPFKVTDLKRTGFGPLALDLPSGDWRWLTAAEVAALLDAAPA